jgi:hypothetical protein
MKLFKLAVPVILGALTLSGCANAGSSKESYSVYLAPQGAGFGAVNGTLDRGGRLQATFNGEQFTGQNANNEIIAKGSKGNTLNCKYSMPGDVGTGSCKLSNGKTLDMKFD